VFRVYGGSGMNNEFKQLAKELYMEGYYFGFSSDSDNEWFSDWALAMQKVANGEIYTDKLVLSCFGEVKRIKNADL